MSIRGRRADPVRVYATVVVAVLVCMVFGRQVSVRIAPVRVRVPGYNQSVSLDSAATTPEASPASQEATRAVTMELMRWIESTGPAESRLRQAFVAGAQDLDPGARRSAGGGSAGALELLLLERIRQQVAGK